MDIKTVTALTSEQLKGLPTIAIPQALQREELRFVKVMTWDKKAFEVGWTKDTHYAFDDPELLSWMAKGGNYGIRTGIGNLLIIDIDEVERMRELGILDLLPPTYIVRTRSGGLHYYYFCPDFDKKRVMYDLILTEKEIINGGRVVVSLHLGEMQWMGEQCVAPSSRFRIIEEDKVTIQLWKEENGLPIATVSREQILAVFAGKVKYNKKIGGAVASSEEKAAAPTEKKPKEKKTAKGQRAGDWASWLDKVRVEDIALPNPILKDSRTTTGEIAGDSPWHGSKAHTGNFSVNVKKNIWHCFSCDSGGGVLELLAVEMGLIECGDAAPGCLKGHYKALLDELRHRGYTVPEVTGKNAGEKNKSLMYILRDTLQSMFTMATSLMGDVFVWEAGAYRSFPEIEIKGILQELAEGMGLQVTPTLIKDTFESLQYKTVSSTNKDPYILPVSNGVLYLDQLRGGKMRFEPYKEGEAPPLSALRVAYDPLATCEPFITHLEETVEEPDKDIDVIQEFFGFTLFKEQKFAKSMVWVGPGRDGKSVVANVLIKMHGETLVCGVAPHNMSDRFSHFEMYGKMLNVVAEMPKARIMESRGFKEATGNDFIRMEAKFARAFMTKVFLKHLFLANKVSSADDQSDAYYDRFIFIVFPHQFGIGGGAPAKDTSREEKLSTPAMLSGVLNWSLAGLERLFKNDDFSHQGDLIDRIRMHDAFTEPVDIIEEVATKLCVRYPSAEVNMRVFMDVLEQVCFMRGLSMPSQSKVTRVLTDPKGLGYKVVRLRGLISEGARDERETWIMGMQFVSNCETAYEGLIKANRSTVKAMMASTEAAMN